MQRGEGGRSRGADVQRGRADVQGGVGRIFTYLFINFKKVKKEYNNNKKKNNNNIYIYIYIYIGLYICFTLE